MKLQYRANSTSGNQTMQTALVWDERYMWYDFGTYTRLFNNTPYLQPGTVVESPESKRRIMNLLAATSMLEHLAIIAPQALSEEQLLLVHTQEYIEKIQAMSADNGGDAGLMAPVPRYGYDILCLAAGGTKSAIDSVLSGEAKNAYALVRPPGHHAEPDKGMGLCVFANVALATKAAMLEHGLKKVAIVDWDVHHGNGYEAAFIDDPNVLVVSVHQDLAIAGSGSTDQNGEGEGKGFNINIPLPPGSGPGAYYASFDRVVLPALRRFDPDLIVVASGLDAASNDPTARMMLNADSYRQLTRRMMDVANEVCDGRLVLSHEGGYDATLAPFCALAIFEELSGVKSSMPDGANPFERPGAELNKYQRLMPHQNECIEDAEKLLRTLDKACKP